MKQQVSTRSSSASARQLLDIFGKATQTDIRSQAEVLRLLKLALVSAGHPSRRSSSGPGVNLSSIGPDGASYVTVTPETMHALAREFIGVQPIGELQHHQAEEDDTQAPPPAPDRRRHRR